MKKRILKYKDILLYFVFGVATTVVNFAAFKLFNVLIGEQFYLVSNIIAWFLSVVFAYITNKLFVFRSLSWAPSVLVREMLSFFAARVFSFLLEEGGLYLFVDVLNFDRFRLTLCGITLGGKMIAKLILAVIVVLLNYLFSKLYIFKKPGSPTEKN